MKFKPITQYLDLSENSKQSIYYLVKNAQKQYTQHVSISRKHTRDIHKHRYSDSSSDDKEYIFIDLETNGTTELHKQIVDIYYENDDGQQVNNTWNESTTNRLRYLPDFCNEHIKKRIPLIDATGSPVKGVLQQNQVYEVYKFLKGIKCRNLIAHNAPHDFSIIAKNLSRFESYEKSKKSNPEEPEKSDRDKIVLGDKNEYSQNQYGVFTDFSFDHDIDYIDTLDLAHLAYPNIEKYSLKDLMNKIDDDKVIMTPDEKDILEKYKNESHTSVADVKGLRLVVEKLFFNKIKNSNLHQEIFQLLPGNYVLKRWLIKRNILDERNILLGDLFTETGEGCAEDKEEYSTVNNNDGMNDDDVEKIIESFEWGYKTKPNKDASGRPGKQFEIINAVKSNIDKRNISLLEAGTGTGKTLGYLVPVYEFLNTHPDENYIISTHTKALQEQVRETIDEINSNNMNKYLKYAVVKGKGNYLCPYRLCEILKNVYDLYQENKKVDDTNVKYNSNSIIYYIYIALKLFDNESGRRFWDGDLEEMPVHISSNFDPTGICRKNICYDEQESKCSDCDLNPNRKQREGVGSISTKSTICPIIRKLNKIRNPYTRIIIANHALMMSEQHVEQDSDNTNTSFPNVIKKKASNIIFDEGHRLEEAYKSVNSPLFESSDIEKILNECSNKITYPLDKIKKQLNENECIDKEKQQNKRTILDQIAEIQGYLNRNALKKAFEDFSNDIIAYAHSTKEKESIYAGQRRFGIDIHSFDLLENLLRENYKVYSLFLDYTLEDLDNIRDFKEKAEEILFAVTTRSKKFRDENIGQKLAEDVNDFLEYVCNNLSTNHNKKDNDTKLETVINGKNNIEKLRGSLKDYFPCIYEGIELNDKVNSTLSYVFSIEVLKKIIIREYSLIIVHQILKWYSNTNHKYEIEDPEYQHNKCFSKTDGFRDVFNYILNKLTEKYDTTCRLKFNYNLDVGFYTEYTNTNIEYEEGVPDLIDNEYTGIYEKDNFNNNYNVSHSKRSYMRNEIFRIVKFENDVRTKINELLSSFQRVCIISATLLVDNKNDGKNFFEKRYGLNNPEKLKVPSPFDYSKQIKVCLPYHITSPAGYIGELHAVESLLENVRILDFLKEQYMF